MAKTSAERQAAYRARRNDGEGDRRINTWISTKADLALERLAHRYGVTKREMIERLVNSAGWLRPKPRKIGLPYKTMSYGIKT